MAGPSGKPRTGEQSSERAGDRLSGSWAIPAVSKHFVKEAKGPIIGSRSLEVCVRELDRW